MYSANAGGIWLSFFIKDTYAVNGAKFISDKSKIKKNNLKKNVMIVGEVLLITTYLERDLYFC